jgi:hypothetical protein
MNPDKVEPKAIVTGCTTMKIAVARARISAETRTSEKLFVATDRTDSPIGISRYSCFLCFLFYVFELN